MTVKKKPKSKPPTDAERTQRFFEVARKIGASDDPRSIVPAFRRVVKPR
jgi:hypothetical protein